MTGRAATAAACAVLVLLAAWLAWRPGGQRPVVVGVGAGVEQRVLAAIAVQALRDAGIAAEPADVGGDTRGLRGAAAQGDIDLYWDYTGAAWALSLGQEDPDTDPRESFDRVAVAEEGSRSGLRWLGPSQANATLALFVRADDVAEGDRTLSWVARSLSEGRGPLCADPAFVTRDGGLPSLAEAYAIGDGLAVVEADEAEAIEGVAEGRCFAGLATATSGTARNAALVPVADDLTVFPAFVVAPVVRRATLARVPGLEAALAPALSRLTTEQLAGLNAVAEGEQADVTALAQRFLGSA